MSLEQAHWASSIVQEGDSSAFPKFGNRGLLSPIRYWVDETVRRVWIDTVRMRERSSGQKLLLDIYLPTEKKHEVATGSRADSRRQLDEFRQKHDGQDGELVRRKYGKRPRCGEARRPSLT